MPSSSAQQREHPPGLVKFATPNSRRGARGVPTCTEIPRYLIYRAVIIGHVAHLLALPFSNLTLTRLKRNVEFNLFRRGTCKVPRKVTRASCTSSRDFGSPRFTAFQARLRRVRALSAQRKESGGKSDGDPLEVRCALRRGSRPEIDQPWRSHSRGRDRCRDTGYRYIPTLLRTTIRAVPFFMSGTSRVGYNKPSSSTGPSINHAQRQLSKSEERVSRSEKRALIAARFIPSCMRFVINIEPARQSRLCVCCVR